MSKTEGVSNIAIKEVLHNYIETGDDKLLQMIYALIREYNNPVLSDDDIAILESRSLKRERGESKTYEWTEAKTVIINAS